MGESPKQFYSRDPAGYDEVTDRSKMPDSFLALRDTFIDEVGTGAVLDVGCGPGHDTQYFDRQEGINAVGIDLAPGMTEYARKTYDVTAAEMDMRDLHIDDEVYDGVWCNASIFLSPEDRMREAVDEIYRVLKSDGVAQISYKIGDGTITKEGSGGETVQYKVSDVTARDMIESAGFTVDEALSEINEPFEGKVFANYFCNK